MRARYNAGRHQNREAKSDRANTLPDIFIDCSNYTVNQETGTQNAIN
ncbi:hypothetical protein HMPREF0208_04168 [Citrobacter koseri]|nr:hypothetical protein HMPREF3220_02811 [Citrobacter koseri]KXA04666.1 hypothetical protein HMPREF3207_01253 [Citrobacter koseri]KXB40688.1 hypothetical protein HMPREF0208_04168 [Citrobacter koseri]